LLLLLLLAGVLPAVTKQCLQLLLQAAAATALLLLLLPLYCSAHQLSKKPSWKKGMGTTCTAAMNGSPWLQPARGSAQKHITCYSMQQMQNTALCATSANHV
jgi:hypothetical protein